MTETDLIEIFQSKLAGNAEFSELHALLQDFRGSGGLQEVAYRALKIVREKVDDETEDTVLDLMDVVVGYCSPHSKIWPHYLKT